MQFELENVDYKGRVFTENVTVERSPATGPGWYIFARDKNGTCMLVARPSVPARKHPHYNIAVRRGWLRKCDAEFIASTVANLIRP